MSKRVKNSTESRQHFLLPVTRKKKKKKSPGATSPLLRASPMSRGVLSICFPCSKSLRLMMCVSVVSYSQVILNFIGVTNGQHIYSTLLLDGIVISNRILHFSSIDVYVLLTLGSTTHPLPHPTTFLLPGGSMGGMGRGSGSGKGEGEGAYEGERRGFRRD